MRNSTVLAAGLLALASVLPVEAQTRLNISRQDRNAPNQFHFSSVPVPSRRDAAGPAKFTLVDGTRDENGGRLDQLHDGLLPRGEDEPSANFFFAQGRDGGRIQIDLGTNTIISQINTYSWHGGSRGPQVYVLYASPGTAAGFKAEPKRGTDPQTCGWQQLAKVDTRPSDGQIGGPHGVSVTDHAGNLGRFRFLLFDISRTEDHDPFGNTFFSEIDVVDPAVPPLPIVTGTPQTVARQFTAAGGKYQFTLNATLAPDLMEWAETELRPVVQEWYPKLVELLPSEGFKPATNVTLRFRDDMGGVPASAGGGFINLNAGWFRKELKREARGSVVHEMVHVVQNYRGGRRNNPNAGRLPDWLIEGIPDYIRWYLYEPQSKGAEITPRNLARAKYDASYRVTGNFLNWVGEKYDSNIVARLNAAGRAGNYREQVWKDSTGKSVQELGDEWKKFHQQRLADAPKPEVRATEPKDSTPP